MPRPVRPWFRCYVEMFADRKLLRLTPTQRWLWVAILGAVRESPVHGQLFIAEGEPMTLSELARYADVKERDVKPALEMMARLGMVTLQDSVVCVTNWAARQFESDNVTERTRDHRNRSKEHRRNVPTNVPGNIPETETEAETELTTPPPPPPDLFSSPQAATDAEFEGFWQHYPRKVGKGSAVKAYRTARRKVDMETIADALRVFAPAMAGRDPDKIPHPATWLNREPWHDDPDAIAPLPTPRPTNGHGFDHQKAMARALAQEAQESA